MQRSVQILLWRVDWVHRNGYLAPHYYVEAKKGKDRKASRRNAIKVAQERSRLANFPNTWFCKITEETEDSD